jgi:hypothetical protein
METAAAHSFGYQARNITDAAGRAQLPEVAVLRRPRDHCPERSRSGLYGPDALRRLFPFTRSITMRAGVALGRGAVVVEAEARVAQPVIREGALCQNRHGSRQPWVPLLTFVSTTLSVPLDLYTR